MIFSMNLWFPLIAAGVVVFRYYRIFEIGTETEKQKNRVRTILVPGSLFPMLLIMPLIVAFMRDPGYAYEMFLSRAFIVFFTICFYQIILLALMPLLRRHFSPAVCASLWTLTDMLYIRFYLTVGDPVPAVVININEKLVTWMAVIWLGGFVLSFGRKLMIHLAYRKALLKEAVPVEGRLMEIYQEELEKFDLERFLPKKEYVLLATDKTRTPLTIGVFRSNTRILIPHTDYSESDFWLIIRHELAHIAGGDCFGKFFIQACNSMLWFIPFNYMAAEKMAEDMEAACDEAVLVDEDEVTRYRYANLLLSVPGSSIGFTSCLSATGQSLKHRMEKALHPKKYKEIYAGLLLGLSAFLICALSGFVRLSPEQTTVSQAFLGREAQTKDLERTIDYMNAEYVLNGKENRYDMEALLTYLNTEKASRLYATLDPGIADDAINIYFDNGKSEFNYAEIGPHYMAVHEVVEINPIFGAKSDESRTRYYYLSDNWFETQ